MSGRSSSRSGASPRRQLRVDRFSLLVLALGLLVIVVVLVTFRTTTARQRDHTRGVLVVQHVGRQLSNASAALQEAALSGEVRVHNAQDIEREIGEARSILHEAIDQGGSSGGFGVVRDADVRDRLRALDRQVDAWAADVRAVLRPTASSTERASIAGGVRPLRAETAAIGELVERRSEADQTWLTAIQIGLVAVFACTFGLLGWQVARNRRTLAERNDELADRVARRTAQLSASEARIRAVIESTLDAVVVMDGRSVITEWNPRAEEMTGIPREAVVGGPPPEDVYPPKLAAFHVDALRRYEEDADPAHFNARFEDVTKGPDGSAVPIEITVAAARSDEGVTISHFVRDISERLRAQAEIEEARDAAERAATAKSAFLATMSHEIRTPMNAIVGMTSLLTDTPLTSEQREYVATIRTSGDALLAIINDILDFSKIESGKLELERHPFAVRDVIESALDLLAPPATAKGLDLGYLLETDGSTQLIGDSTRLRQVLINFLSNAVKFTDAGSVTVHGRLTAAGEDRARLRLEVRDTGIGIPADRLDRLFRSFSQVDASTTRKFGGTGLGLAISKRLAEAMEGRVEVISAPGEGSTFAVDVTLPRLPGPDPVTSGVPSVLRGRSVLVVDDSAVNRQLLDRQLTSWGLRVDGFELPLEALDRVRAGERYDVALIDMQMPEMDGLTLADRIAEATAYRLPIVLLSSIGGVDPALARGRLAATLSKPVKPATLRSALVDALAGGSGFAERPAPAPALRPERPLHVLVAEDNAVNQRVAVATLERLGHRADVAADGLEAIAALVRQKYDLVLMDMQMPNLDGLGATRRIRAELPPERQPRIVAMTANAFSEDRDACRDAGMDDFLTKPVERAELLRALAGTPAVQAPVPPACEAVAIDAERLEAATGGDEAMTELLIDLHAEEGSALVAALRDAAALADRNALRAAAHTFTSSSASVGATALSALCAGLEAQARGGAVEDAAERVEQISAAFDASLAALRRLHGRT